MPNLRRIPDPEAVYGFRWLYPYAYGGLAPLLVRGITYGGKTPENNTGLTFRLLIKAQGSDSDAEAIVDVTDQADFTFTSGPLQVGYLLDTTTEGFAPGGEYDGELWVLDSDAAYGAQLVNEFRVALSTPDRKTFS